MTSFQVQAMHTIEGQFPNDRAAKVVTDLLLAKVEADGAEVLEGSLMVEYHGFRTGRSPVPERLTYVATCEATVPAEVAR